MTTGTTVRVAGPYFEDLERGHVERRAPALTLAEWVDLDVAVSDCFSGCAQALLRCAELGAGCVPGSGSHFAAAPGGVGSRSVT